jgi:ASC-1-like (ASCH) protein
MENKKRVFFIAKSQKGVFDAIKSGAKTVETRAATVRNSLAQGGDTAVFICNKERVEKRIRAVRKCSSVAALLKVYPVSSINPSMKEKKELEEMYDSFPGYAEKIKEFGIIALELE